MSDWLFKTARVTALLSEPLNVDPMDFIVDLWEQLGITGDTERTWKQNVHSVFGKISTNESPIIEFRISSDGMRVDWILQIGNFIPVAEGNDYLPDWTQIFDLAKIDSLDPSFKIQRIAIGLFASSLAGSGNVRDQILTILPSLRGTVEEALDFQIRINFPIEIDVNQVVLKVNRLMNVQVNSLVSIPINLEGSPGGADDTRKVTLPVVLVEMDVNSVAREAALPGESIPDVVAHLRSQVESILKEGVQ